MRSLTKYGIGLLAVLVMSGAMASAASAAEFLSAKSPLRLFGAQDPTSKHKITIDGQVVECNVAEVSAAMVTTPAKILTLVPKYEKCIVFGFTEAQSTVSMNGCTFEMLQPNGAFEGNLAIRCPAGNAIKFHAKSAFSECEALVGEGGNNGNLAKITYANSGGMPNKVHATFAITTMTANKTIDSGFCGLSGKGVVNNVTFAGKSTIEGKEIGAEVPVSIEVK